MLNWSNSIAFIDAGQTLTFSPDPGTADTITADFASSSTNVGYVANSTGLATFNGPLTAVEAHSILTGGAAASPGHFHVVITQNGVTVLDVTYPSTAPFDHPDTFNFADTLGSTQPVVFSVDYTSGGTFPFGAWHFTSAAS
jgi:hypothetical protein